MELLFTLLSFAAISIYSLVVAQIANCKKALAPLGGVCFTIFYFSVASWFNVLILGGYIFFLGAAACLFWLIKNKKSDFWLGFCRPSVYFFLLASLGVIFLFAIRKPLFSTWDEFSLWATAAKLVKISGRLYTTAEIQWAWTATQKPGLILLGYFFDFFGSHAEWRIAAGYDVLLFSCFAALLEPLHGKARSLAAPAALIAFLTPFLFTVYDYYALPSTVYFSALGDIPMGILMAGCLIAWFAEKEHNNVKSFIIPALALFALAYTRDTAFPLAMIAAGIMLVDCVVKAFADKKNVLISVVKGFGLLCVPVAAFVSWMVYLNVAVNVNSFEVGGQDNKNMISLLASGVAELFGVGTTEKFTAIMGNMFSSFFNIKLTVFGSGVILVAAFILITVVALLCQTDKALRIRHGIAALMTGLGFVAFYVFTGFCFVYVLKPIEAESMSGYIRYVFPYYIAWFMLVMYFLLSAAASHSKKAILVGRMFVFAICAVFFVGFIKILPAKNTVIDYYDDFLLERRQAVSYSQQVQQNISKEDGNIFFVSQGDNGMRWFTYCCDMLPLQLDYSFGGGTIAAPGAMAEDTLYYIPLTQAQLKDYLVKNNCKYVFIERIDNNFYSEYKSLFSDELVQCQNGKSALYETVANGGTVMLKLVKTMENI